MNRNYTSTNTGTGRVEQSLLGMSPVVKLAFYALMSIFYFSNYYDWSLATALAALKWTLSFTFAATVLLVAKRRDIPKGMVAVLPAVLLALIALTVGLSEDISTSAAYFVGVVLVISASWLFAGHISSRFAQAQFFEIIANVGRVVIFSNGVMLAAGLSLGRGNRFSGWTDNPNTLALMLAPTLIILIAQILERRRNVLLWNVPFLLVGLLLMLQTDSRASLLWVAVAGLAMFAFRQGVGISFWLSLVVGVAAVLWWNDISGFVLSLVDRSRSGRVDADILSGRSEMWPVGLDFFFQKPLTGHGPGMSEGLLDGLGAAFKEAEGEQFHNSYLTILVEYGVVVAAAVLLVIGTAVWGGVRTSSLVNRQRNRLWPIQGLPWVILLGALGHAFFETWIMSPGNANSYVLWTCIWILVNQHVAARNSPGEPPIRATRPRARKAIVGFSGKGAGSR